MKLGKEAARRRIVTVEVIPDRVSPAGLSLLRERVDAVTIPALRNGWADASYPSGYNVTPQQRSIACSLLVRRVGLEVVPSLTCRDCRREDLGELRKLEEEGLENVLAVFGDPFGDGRDVYDFPTTDALIRAIKVNNGPLSIGAITNQYARSLEREVERAESRVDAGAEYVLSNTVFDEQLALEHRDRLLDAGIRVPILFQVSIPHSAQNLLYVSKKFGIPVPDRLVRRLQRSSSNGVDFAVEMFERLKIEARGVHFSYLLRKRDPIPVYARLLDGIGAEGLQLTVPLRATQKAA